MYLVVDNFHEYGINSTILNRQEHKRVVEINVVKPQKNTIK